MAWPLGGVLGFYVGATPLYLLANANGGPYKLPVESLERRSSVLVDVHASRPRTPTEVAEYEVGLAGADMIVVADELLQHVVGPAASCQICCGEDQSHHGRGRSEVFRCGCA